MQKKLVKSRTDRKICGVCGGIAEYINLDPTVVRILWIIFSFWGVGILAYIACAFVMPD
ncbi:PspC domain-containing protein [Lachnoclostridium phytofermentans]|uniref:Phage shock protein C, PspC n=1 Tax=Lachnoclostridium phytofermentans (strain ATCC 700394 / DSM 18823 / ISDg) TaxID=357809 RepID=A9KNQ0_LACP7|nr:PspC domain-containing protein [Lachnoclostridium phytofermentans]ABX41651.1 phage shock protein C, PspC [Lachnoclostridium phytofermentans ISDg]